MQRHISLRGAVGVAAAFVLTTACASSQTGAAPETRLSDADVDRIAARVAEYMEPVPADNDGFVTYRDDVRGVRADVRPAAQPTTRHTPTERAVYPPVPNPKVFGPVPDVTAADAKRAAAASVDSALEWLSRHQSPDGSWKPDGFQKQCDGPACEGTGQAVYTPGMTGLAVLCFLGDGADHRGGPYGDRVDKALQYLRTIQDPDGCFGPRISQHYMYNHALASLAMVEAYQLTRSPLFRKSAQSAVNFIHFAQNPYLGWRYGVREGDNDTSMTNWMVMVLSSARAAGLDVDDAPFRGAVSWVDKMTEPEFGRVGYIHRGGPTARTMEAMDKFPPEHSEAMTAAGILVRLNSGQPTSHELIQKGAKLLAKRPPTWNVESGTNDFYYWQLGTMAMQRLGGADWAKWRSALHVAATKHQRVGSGDSVGSWSPIDPWSNYGGRIYATTTLCLALQVVEHSP